MLYLYDKSICKELERSFDPDNMGVSAVKVIDPDMAVDVLAQIQNDDFELPAVILTRSSDFSIDNARWNFSQIHNGIATVFDDDTNMIYYERAIPIDLSYNLTVLAANQADMDELTRELIFKFSDTYFFNIDSPYESSRNMRFGVMITPDSTIEQSSRNLEYFTAGKIYQSIIRLQCEGCVLLHYRPVHLHRYEDPDIEVASSNLRHVNLYDYNRSGLSK